MTRRLLLVLLAFSLAGCGLLEGPVPSEIDPTPSPTPVAATADLLILGAIEPDPLLESSFVAVMRRGYELALAETDSRVGGLRIELLRSFPPEFETDPGSLGIDQATEIGFSQSAAALARTEPRLVAYLGPNHKYAFDDGSVERVCRAGLTMMSPISTSPSVGSGCPEQRFFRASASTSGNGRAAARYLAEEGLTRVVVLLSKNDPDRKLSAWEAELDAFRSEARRGGLTILAESDVMNTSAGAITRLRPDAFVLLGRTEEPEAARFWRLREQIAVIPAVVANSAVRDRFEPIGRVSEPAGRTVVASAIPVPAGIPGYAGFVERWRAQFGEAPPPADEWLAMNSYAAMRTLLVAIERAIEEGAASPAEIRGALPSIIPSLEFTGAPYEQRWGFTGSGERYPAVGGIYLLDFTLSEVDGMFPVRTIVYE
jgi:ABC-type branched-subunit amino acid transport system substrate-binding protein